MKVMKPLRDVIAGPGRSMLTLAVICLSCLLLPEIQGPSCLAAGLDDAKALLKEQKYAQAEKILDVELAQAAKPSQDMLRLAVESAVGCGKIVTAQKRVTALLAMMAPKNAGEPYPDAAVLFQGAVIADQAGEYRLALSRYLAFTQQEKDKSANLEKALRYLCAQGVYPAEYKRFVDLFGSTEASWELGYGMLDKLIEAGDAPKALEIAEFLGKHLPTTDKSAAACVDRLHFRLRSAADNSALGKDPKERFVNPLKVMVDQVPGDYSHLVYLMKQASASLTDEQKLAMITRVQAAAAKSANKALPAELFQYFYAMKTLSSAEARAKAGKDFLALDGLYLPADAAARNADSPEHAAMYLKAILDMPEVFCPKAATASTSPASAGPVVLVSAQQAIDRLEALDATFKDYFAQRPARLSPLIAALHVNYLAGQGDQDIAFLKKNIARLSEASFADLVRSTKGQDLPNMLAAATAGKSYKDTLALRVALMSWYAQSKDAQDKAQLLAVAREYMTAYSGSFNPQTIKAGLLDSTLSDEEKASLLTDIAVRSGSSVPMRGLLKDVKALAGNPKFQAFRAAVETRQGPSDKSDLVMSTQAALFAIAGDARKSKAAIADVMSRFLSQYKGPVPSGAEQAKDAAELAVWEIFIRHMELMSASPDGLTQWSDAWAPKLPLGPGWDVLTTRLREKGQYPALHKAAAIYVGLLKDQPGSSVVWKNLAAASGASATAAGGSPLAACYGKMAIEDVVGYILNQKNTWDAKLFMDELTRLAAMDAFKSSPQQLAIVAQQLSTWQGARNKVLPSLSKSLWDCYAALLQKDPKLADPATESCLLALYVSGGAPDAAAQVASYLQSISSRGTAAQVSAVTAVLRQVTLTPEVKGALVPGMKVSTVLKVFKPVYEKLLTESPSQAASLAVPRAVPDSLAQILRDWPDGEAKKDALKLAYRLSDALQADSFQTPQKRSELLAAGPSVLTMLDCLAKDAMDRQAWSEMAGLLSVYSRMLAQQGNWSSGADSMALVNSLAKTLEAKNAPELEYTFINGIERQATLDDKTARQLAVFKAKAASQIPGLIYVNRSDPAYDLHMAANSLSLHNEATAWELTAPKLSLVQKNWETLDSEYVAWCIDQMRKQRKFKEALEFAMTVLMREADIEAPVAAKVSLAKGDIYRDQENYQAARIEYESLRNNPRYKTTESGGKATYRLIDLLIFTKDFTAAEGLIQRLVDSDSIEVQAEGYYLMAKMAYLQQNYRGASDYVKKVKERVLNHVEASFLEGELNLLLPGGLQHTEVAVGNPKLSTIAIPGRVLTLKLQDSNLRIARGGSAIPVVIRTSRGHDEEHIKLVPSSADKTLFTGTIATALGKVTPGNMQLELRGDDEVQYQIEPDFQKANALEYPIKSLEVRYDASLSVSSGDILTEEEEEKAAQEKLLQKEDAAAAKSKGAASGELRKFEMLKDNRTVRPGSNVFVQVIDLDRDVSDEKDTIKVDLRTSSGDVLDGFVLTETDTHSGVFRGAVPTGLPLPRASASDSDENALPSILINSTKTGAWKSLPDAKKPKWVEVDTMSSHQVKTAALELVDPAAIKRVSLQGMLADDYEELASFSTTPVQTKPSQAGGLTLELAADRPASTADAMRKQIKLRAGDTSVLASPSFSRQATPVKGKANSMTARISGTFYVLQNKPVNFKFIHEARPGSNQTAYLFIDDQEVLGGSIDESTIQNVRRVDLNRGPHKLELLLSDSSTEARAEVGIQKDDGTFEPMPAAWFSVKDMPELAAALKPKGQAAMKDGVLTVTLDQPVRLRKLKWVFEDFSGSMVSAKRITVVDSDGKTILPTKDDFSSGLTNSTLEIAPGDTITVSYNDQKRLRQDMAVLSRSLIASFFNGTIMMAEEVLSGGQDTMSEKFFPIKRCKIGNQVMVVITDYDGDVTAQRDTMDVEVSTSSGQHLTLKALESQSGTGKKASGDTACHTGVFLANFKIGETTGKDTIAMVPGDQLTVAYVDKENTNPGVPVMRTYTAREAGTGAPSLIAYRTAVALTDDRSPEAAAFANRNKGRRATSMPTLQKEVVIARYPTGLVSSRPPLPTTSKPATAAATTPAPATPIISASVSAPLMFELTYPREALNSGSTVQVTAVAESDLRAAKRENRDPNVVTATMHLHDVASAAASLGYNVQVQTSTPRTADDMLRDGVFAGAIRLQLGKAGDAGDSAEEAPATGAKRPAGKAAGKAAAAKQPAARAAKDADQVPLIVSGSDIVHLKFHDEQTQQESSMDVRLLSDAHMELMDSSYMAQCETIHLGDRFYVKLTDPDHDVSDERDTVTISLQCPGEKTKMVLTETLAHSGVFTGVCRPAFKAQLSAASQPTTSSTETVVGVNFGDQITFEYIDDMPLTANQSPRVTKIGRIYPGCDGQVAVFSKVFKDPEMAVKTNFLTSEALFELAKEHRKLNQNDKADEEIARGKRILEEALRDYPNTSLAAQGEFLLANLAQELNNLQEAVGRYSAVISSYPESEYASRSQFKKAYCLEKLGQNEQACEEYVKVIYIYPDSGLAADATVRLGNYYYRQSAFKVAGTVFYRFQQRNPTHAMAPKALFLAGQCFYKMTDYPECIRLFSLLVEQYPDARDLRAEAMYWLGDSSYKAHDYVKAYQAFKKLTWDYPESQWAKIARGRLTEEMFSKMD